MYQKYYTEALILRSRDSGEADRIYTLYTKDFGLVVARASAVRSEHSRMRYALQSYSRATVALIKGRRGWRLAGAAALSRAEAVSQGLPTFVRIAELLLRLVTEQERNEYLFAVLAETHGALLKGEHKTHATIEIVCVARILYALGYLSPEALETALFAHTAYTGDHLHEAEVLREKLLASINRAITEAQL